MPEFERWSFIGWPLGRMVDDIDHIDGWHQAMWIIHVVSFIAFLIILPTTMLRHMFTSPLNMYLTDKDRPKGAMRPMPNLVEGDTELETFGASTIEDFTWKQLLDTLFSGPVYVFNDPGSSIYVVFSVLLIELYYLVGHLHGVCVPRCEKASFETHAQHVYH